MTAPLVDDTTIAHAARALAAARREWHETNAALRHFMEQSETCCGLTISEDSYERCYQSHRPIEEWCPTCQGSQPLWQAYRHAAAKAGRKLRYLMRLCEP